MGFRTMAFAHIGPRIGLLAYMDDVILCSSAWNGHMKLLEDTFISFQAAGLTLKPSKAHFGPNEVKENLGHVISHKGIKIGSSRVHVIINLPQPTIVKELPLVLGMTKFVQKFIPIYAALVMMQTSST